MSLYLDENCEKTLVDSFSEKLYYAHNDFTRFLTSVVQSSVDLVGSLGAQYDPPTKDGPLASNVVITT